MSIFLSSERITLRSICRNDLERLRHCMSDPEIRALTGEVYPLTEKKLEEFIELNQNTDSRIWFLITDSDSEEIIGETGFLRIFMPWRTSDFSLIIWNREYWGRGFGKESAGLMLDYGFNTLNFHRLSIGVAGFNERALRFWESIGFKKEGIQRDGYFAKGKYSDFIMMSMLEDEYHTHL